MAAVVPQNLLCSFVAGMRLLRTMVDEIIDCKNRRICAWRLNSCH